MNTMHLYQQITHRYKSCFRDLDESVYVGVIKCLAGRMLDLPMSEDDYYCDAQEWVFWVIVPKAIVKRYSKKAMRQMLHDAFSRSGCSHDYDCCGCRSTSTSVVAQHGNRFVLHSHSSRNY